MYDNIGGKLKTLAKIEAGIGIVGSIISGIIMIAQGGEVSSYIESAGSTMIGTGFLVMIVGSLASLISSWSLYAIGDISEKITEMYFGSSQTRVQERPQGGVKRRVCASCGYVGYENKCPQCGCYQWVVNISSAPTPKPPYSSDAQCDLCGEKVFCLIDVVIGTGQGAKTLHLCGNCVKKYDACEPFRTDFDPTGINEYTLTGAQKEAIADQKNSELIDCLFDTDFTLEYRCQCYRELQKRGMILPNA